MSDEDEFTPDLMDLALAAMERGDHELGLKLARESNERMRKLMEWKYRVLAPHSLIRDGDDDDA